MKNKYYDNDLIIIFNFKFPKFYLDIYSKISIYIETLNNYFYL